MAMPVPSKPFSISLSAKRKPSLSAAKPLNHSKRPYSSLAEDDSENEDSASKTQLVTAFDHSAGGAIGINDREQERGPLVIRAQKNRDWRGESYRKKGKNLLPEEVQALKSGVTRQGSTVAKERAPQEFGLTFVRPRDKSSDGDITNGDQDAAVESSVDAVRPPDEDEEAMNALLGKDTKRDALVLPTAGNDKEVNDAWTQRGNEDEIFRSDVVTRPDPPSLDDYANVPVEQYGAAMLRGMKGNIVGDRISQAIKPRDMARRPALLGIGAKEVPDEIEELGAWGKAAKGKRKVEKIYNPVLLRNSETGEMISEEELERRKQNGKMEDSDWRERRDRNLALDAENKGGRKLVSEEDGRRSGPTSGIEVDQNGSGMGLLAEKESDLVDTAGTAPHGKTGVDHPSEVATALQDEMRADQVSGNTVNETVTVSMVTLNEAIETAAKDIVTRNACRSSTA